jgi:GT2 family glycosyltransferase
MKISLVIPVYFCDLSLFLPIEMCLSTLRSAYPDIEPILVDDASPLDCPDHWNIAETNVINMGYTATVNKGLRVADGDIIIVANDDIEFHPGCLDRFFDLPDNVIASPADTASGDLESFGCIFGMTRATFERMGLLDEKYRNFMSDVAYRERAESLGIEIVKWRDIVIKHHESTTFKVLGNKEELLREDQERYSA